MNSNVELAIADNKAKVIEALQKAGKPLRPADIVTATGLPKEEVGKLLKELKKEGKVPRQRLASTRLQESRICVTHRSAHLDEASVCARPACLLVPQREGSWSCRLVVGELG